MKIWFGQTTVCVKAYHTPFTMTMGLSDSVYSVHLSAVSRTKKGRFPARKVLSYTGISPVNTISAGPVMYTWLSSAQSICSVPNSS